MLRRLLPFVFLMSAATGFAQAAASAVPEVGMAGHTLLWKLLATFAAGIGVSFTPCVYPMIPITLSIIGARSLGQKPIVGFLRSLVFVLGIALIYSALGYGAALSGRTMSFVFQNKWFMLGFALFFIAMGLSMLDLFTIQMPAGMAGKLQGGANRGGFLGAFLVGIVTGVVASPCGSPVLVSALTMAAQSGTGAVGVAMLFTYALGLGMLFLVLGTFPAFLKAVPKSGAWMDDIKKLLGAVLIGVGLSYLGQRPSVLGPLAFWLVVLGGALAGALWLAITAAKRRKHLYLMGTWNTLAACLAVYAVFVAVAKVPPAIMVPNGKGVMSSAQVAARVKREIQNLDSSAQTAEQVAGVSAGKGQSPQAAKPQASSEWHTSETLALAEAKQLGLPMIIDFGAEWCAACKELEHKTFPSPEVKNALQGFVKLKVDATEETEENSALQKKYGAVSLPTVILIDKDGKVRSDLTLLKFEEPAEFVKRLQKVAP